MRESTIYFYGGAGSVTGSNFMLDTHSTGSTGSPQASSGQARAGRFLIDCGMQQGMREESNWDAFAYDPKSVSHLIITHAHIDHIGRIPRLVRQGFSGTIISTHATRALAEPLLHDAMELSGMGEREPLYEAADIARAMGMWKGIGYHEKIDLPDGVALELLDAGHILGSAMVKFMRPSTELGASEQRSVVFTGDLGGGNSPLLSPTEKVTGANYVVMESVYGDRTRPDDGERRERLENIIEETATRGGTLLIPAFSTERTQDLMYEIRTLMMEKRIPSLPVFVDSPLAAKITAAFIAYPEYFAAPIRARVEAGEKIFLFPELEFVEGVEESRKVLEHAGPKILLAGSGMSMGGRVVGHERRILPDEKSTLLIVGYQSAGSLGRRLVEGAKEVTIYKERVPVRCRVETLYGYSAHRDGQGLLDFAGDAQGAEEIFVVEGEPAAAAFLAQRIRDYLGVKATTPEAGEKAVIQF